MDGLGGGVVGVVGGGGGGGGNPGMIWAHVEQDRSLVCNIVIT